MTNTDHPDVDQPVKKRRIAKWLIPAGPLLFGFPRSIVNTWRYIKGCRDIMLAKKDGTDLITRETHATLRDVRVNTYVGVGALIIAAGISAGLLYWWFGGLSNNSLLGPFQVTVNIATSIIFILYFTLYGARLLYGAAKLRELLNQEPGASNRR